MTYMFESLVFVFLCYGISNAIIYSNGPWHMFEKWRKFTNNINPMIGELFTCMMCLPFWVGLIISAIDIFLFAGLVFTPFNIIMGSQIADWFVTPIILLFDGFLISGTTWIIHNIEEYFESNSKFE